MGNCRQGGEEGEKDEVDGVECLTANKQVVDTTATLTKLDGRV